MAMIRNGKVYRNIPEQVQKNKEDIENLSSTSLKGGEGPDTVVQKVENPYEEDPAPAENEANYGWAAAFGKSNVSDSYAAFTVGTRNINAGDSALVAGVGNENEAGGMASLVSGESNQNSGRSAFVTGSDNENSGNYSLCAGILLQTNSGCQNAVGTANDGSVTGVKFAVGNGTYSIDPDTGEYTNINRSNAFEVGQYGDVKIGRNLSFTAQTSKIKLGNNIWLNDSSDTGRLRISSLGQIDVNAHIIPTSPNTRKLGNADYPFNSLTAKYINDTTGVNIIDLQNKSLGYLDNPFTYGYINNLTVGTVLNANSINDKLGNNAITITPKPTPVDRELVSVIGNLNVSGVAISTGGVVGSILDSGLTERISVNTSGQAIVKAHVLPDNSNTRTLGTAQKCWKELYLKGFISNGTNQVSFDDLYALIQYAKAQGWIS